MKGQPPSQKLAAINEALSRMPLKRLPAEKVRAQVIQHLSESKSEMFSENFSRFTDDDRSWDIAFWQKQGPAAIFDAMWGMIKDHRLLTKNDATEPRLQRAVEYFGKIGDNQVHFISREDLISVKIASGRDQDLKDVEAIKKNS